LGFVIGGLVANHIPKVKITLVKKESKIVLIFKADALIDFELVNLTDCEVGYQGEDGLVVDTVKNYSS
jgi:hypothetical protein